MYNLYMGANTSRNDFYINNNNTLDITQAGRNDSCRQVIIIRFRNHVAIKILVMVRVKSI